MKIGKILKTLTVVGVIGATSLTMVACGTDTNKDIDTPDPTPVIVVPTSATKQRVKDLVNGLISSAQIEDSTWWTMVVNSGADKIVAALADTNKANLSDSEVNEILDLIDEISDGTISIESPFDVFGEFYNLDIANTKISKFFWYTMIEVEDILNEAAKVDADAKEIKSYYAKIKAFGETKFITAFNALLELGELSPSVFEQFTNISEIANSQSQIPTPTLFKDIVTALKADVISALTVLTPDVMSVLCDLTKAFVPLFSTDINEKSLITDAINLFNGHVYLVARGALFAVLNEIDNATISKVYNFAFGSTQPTYANTKELVDKFANAITSANLGNSDIAVAFKASVKLAVIAYDVQNIVKENGEKPANETEMFNVLNSLKINGLAALDALDNTAVTALANIAEMVLPYFTYFGQDISLLEANLDDVVNYYPALNSSLKAMLNAVDKAKSDILYNNIDIISAGNITDELLIAIAKVADAGLKAVTSGNQASDVSKVLEIINKALSVTGVSFTPADLQIPELSALTMEELVNKIYNDFNDLAQLQLSANLNSSYNNNILVLIFTATGMTRV